MQQQTVPARRAHALRDIGVDEVAVVAAGTIGVSWTALLLAHGLAVRVYDSRPGTGGIVRTRLGRSRRSPTGTER
jgi:3-hydroxyacyl-CoA dehydrogenase